MSPRIAVENFQKLTDYIRFKELTSKNNLNQEDVDDLAREINIKWYKSNRNRLLQK